MICGPVVLCTVLFTRHIWMSLVLPHEHSEPQEAFYCTQSEEQNLSQTPTTATTTINCNRGWTFFFFKHGYQACIFTYRTSRMLNICMFAPVQLDLNAFWRIPTVSHSPENAIVSKRQFFFFFFLDSVDVMFASHHGVCISLFFIEHKQYLLLK